MCDKLCFLHQVFIKCMKEKLDDIHPLALKVAGGLVPIAIGEMAANVKVVVNQLRASEECGGWQYIMTSFYDRQSVTPFIGLRRGPFVSMYRISSE